MLEEITQQLEYYFSIRNLEVSVEIVSGGDIHQSQMISLRNGSEFSDKRQVPSRVFAKFNHSQAARVLKSEFDSLKILTNLCEGLYPKPLFYHEIDEQAMLVMEFHDISSLNGSFIDEGCFQQADGSLQTEGSIQIGDFLKSSYAAQAGRLLAQQHQITHDQFGWDSDNFIGLTPQSNKFDISWGNFFRDQRLVPMHERAYKTGLFNHFNNKIRQVIHNLESFFSHKVYASLLHGDLWSGNLGVDQIEGKPLFFDPAPYFGDREADLAMTELFGKLPSEFYQAYDEVFPREQGYEERIAIYNLYHALNHVVLFGPSYNGLVDSCLERIEI